jgi:hypothetical protein
VDPVPDTDLLRKSDSAGNRTLTTRPQMRTSDHPLSATTYSYLLRGVGHCATSRKVAGSIADEVNGFFQFT